MKKVTIECTNEGMCSNYGKVYEIEITMGYYVKPQQYLCSECDSVMYVEIKDAPEASQAT